MSLCVCGGSLVQKAVLKKIKDRNFRVNAFVCEKCNKISYSIETIKKLDKLRHILSKAYPN